MSDIDFYGGSVGHAWVKRPPAYFGASGVVGVLVCVRIDENGKATRVKEAGVRPWKDDAPTLAQAVEQHMRPHVDKAVRDADRALEQFEPPPVPERPEQPPSPATLKFLGHW